MTDLSIPGCGVVAVELGSSADEEADEKQIPHGLKPVRNDKK
jgi:hypothetical protein